MSNRARVDSGDLLTRPSNVIERNGRVWTRAVGVSHTDPTHVPKELIPPGMVYQWCRHEIVGQEDRTNIVMMQKSGWEPVPADRHDGMFMPRGHKGPIIHLDLMLCERPVEFEMQARAEERMKANTQARENHEQWGFQPAAAGFEQRGASAKSSYSSGADIPRPDLNQIPIAD